MKHKLRKAIEMLQGALDEKPIEALSDDGWVLFTEGSNNLLSRINDYKFRIAPENKISNDNIEELIKEGIKKNSLLFNDRLGTLIYSLGFRSLIIYQILMVIV